MVSLKRVVVIGGGFGGLWAVRALKSAPVDITLIDRCNHHLFQPLLYQVATAGLAAPSIAAPLRHILRKQANVTVLLGDGLGGFGAVPLSHPNRQHDNPPDATEARVAGVIRGSEERPDARGIGGGGMLHAPTQ